MTREEVVKWLKSLKREIGKTENRTLWHYAESIDMAIEALAERPTESDFISKAKVLETYSELYWFDSDCEVVSKAEVDKIYERLQSLPSADRPTGEWVWSDEDASWKCGRCDCVFEEIDWKPNYNFCPNCGAKMIGGDTE